MWSQWIRRTYSRIMNWGCRQTSDPAWLDPKDPAVNKPDLVWLAPAIYKVFKTPLVTIMLMHHVSQMQVKCTFHLRFTNKDNLIHAWCVANLLIRLWCRLEEKKLKQDATNYMNYGFVIFLAWCQWGSMFTAASAWPAPVSAGNTVFSLPFAAGRFWASTSTCPTWSWRSEPSRRSPRAVRQSREGSPPS